MKKGKFVLWLLILGFIALVTFQNEDYFLNATRSLRLNLWVAPEYQTPNLPLVVYHLVFFLFGLLVAFGFSLSTRFRAHKAIKRLTVSVDSQQKELAALKNESARQEEKPAADDPSGQTESSITSPVKPT
jgi:hypothetical protein